MTSSKNKTDISFKKWSLKVMRDFMIIIGFILIIKIFLFDFGFVDGESMEPTLHDGDLLLIKKWDINFKIKDKSKGLKFYDEVVLKDVVFESKKQPIDIVKRVIGLPGDHIEIRNGLVYRNHKLIEEPSIKEKAMQVNQTFDIKEGQIFVMGDNRNNSTDSRHIGPQSINKVSGIVIEHFQAKVLAGLKNKIEAHFN
ncbi:signal peptidase I [Bacillus mexicanus]|uniref:signal peptidase I n=1 Tax=Bacillus mexicanus TaxID=2834415 RepID=UPI003D1F1069